MRRYTEVVGKGRFKQIYKAFDTQIGIDVAWSKISAEPHHLSDEQLQNIVSEMTKGLDLEHPNIIKCFECWEDEKGHCINLITELFTSGNLRQYRNLHKHLDLKVSSSRAQQQLWASARHSCAVIARACWGGMHAAAVSIRCWLGAGALCAERPASAAAAGVLSTQGS